MNWLGDPLINSTALEGNTLVLREVEALLDKGRAVGYGSAARWVYGQALDPDEWSDGTLISLNEVRRIHFLAMGPVWEVAPQPDALGEESPGNFRRHDIRPFDAGMTPPPWPDVPAAMSHWVDSTRASSARRSMELTVGEVARRTGMSVDTSPPARQPRPGCGL